MSVVFKKLFILNKYKRILKTKRNDLFRKYNKKSNNIQEKTKIENILNKIIKNYNIKLEKEFIRFCKYHHI